MDDARNRSPLGDKQRQKKERQDLALAKANNLFTETLWSIDRALFWAATRDRNAMAEYFSSSERAIFLETFSDGQLKNLVEHLNRLGTSRRASIDDLVEAARRGTVTIEGRENSASGWTPIHSGDWGGGESHGGLAVFDDSVRGPYASDPDIGPRKVWNDLRLPRQQVMDAFPEQETPVTPSTDGSANDGPDPSQFDPMKEMDWSLGMAVAWIAYRTVNRVREYWPRWRRAASRDAPEGGLHLLMMREAKTASEGKLSDLDMRVSVRASRRLLWEALRCDHLQAVTLHDGRSHVIPKHEWGQLEPACSATFHDQLHWAKSGRLVGIAYPGPVQIERSSILRAWPPEAPDEIVAPCVATPWQERFEDAAAWFRAEGKEKARIELLAEDKSPSVKSICERAAANWNTDLPSTRRPVKGKSLERANQRTPKGRQ